MKEVRVLPAKKLGYDFIPPHIIPEGEDEFYIRNIQSDRPADYWRNLHPWEIEILIKNLNTCDNWENILVVDPFNPELIKNCVFAGPIRIGRLEDVALEHHDLIVPAGITNSFVIASDIGDNCALHNVAYLAHYIIGNTVVLMNIDEIHTTNYAKFGNGILKEGESEDVRVWIDIINETGTRAILPFDGIIPADAVLWAGSKHDTELQEKLKEMTESEFDRRRGYYGVVGDSTVIKNSRIIKDVMIGDCCYIKGANKLKNLTINSSESEPTQIGEGVELVNGIIGYGCRIFYGCKAVRFIMGTNTNLKYGARLIHSFLGDNSTVSCCEILNNLILPFHEQHHNNSFLIAALIQGQCNVAAGATIGANHNSRANDGEVHAGRGFWPGLCTSIKHTSRFASYTMLVKGDYPFELHITLPFSLVHNDLEQNRLLIIPAYWWRYNMYALARNTWKFRERDIRLTKTQHIEYDFLAPDTVEEIIHAIGILENLIGENPEEDPAEIDIAGQENSRRKQVIRRPLHALTAYRQMLYYYSIKSIIDFLYNSGKTDLKDLPGPRRGSREDAWVNLGGQLVPAKKATALVGKIKSDKISSWGELHRAYDKLWDQYPADRVKHAYATLMWLEEAVVIDPIRWIALLDKFLSIQKRVEQQVFLTREKDYRNSFRQTAFENEAEMQAVLGNLENSSFIIQSAEETKVYRKRVASIKKRLKN